MRMGDLKCSLFGLGQSNQKESARLQIPTLSHLKLDSLSLPQVEVHPPTLRLPQAKPMVPRSILPHPNTSHLLVSPATQPLAGHIQNASNTLPEPRVLVVPTVPVVSPLVLQHEDTSVPAGRTSSAFACGLFSPRSCACFRPRRASWVNRRTSPPMRRVLQLLRGLDPRPSCPACFLHPSEGISRGV